jgi:hypothetical protein
MLEAFFWLEETMKPGIPYNSSRIEKEAGKLEISKNTLNRAKKTLGILSKKQIPPDLVVKFQAIDIAEVILWLGLRLRVVYQQEIKG